MHGMKKFFFSISSIQYNFCFIVLLIIICRIDFAETITSFYLRKNLDNLGDSLVDKLENPVETALLAVDQAVNETNTYNTYPFEMGQEKYYAKGNCTVNNCRDPYGRCENKNACACNVGYAQLPNIKVSKNQLSCTIALKSQSIFFGLEFLTWIGVGHIYAGRLFYGFVKMAFFIMIIILDCILKRFIFNNLFAAKNKSSIVLFSYILYALFLTWQTVDIILIGSNLFKDGNGFKIMTWDK